MVTPQEDEAMENWKDEPVPPDQAGEATDPGPEDEQGAESVDDDEEAGYQ